MSKKKSEIEVLVSKVRPEYERRAQKLIAEPVPAEVERANFKRRDGRGALGSHHFDGHGDLLLELAVELTAKALGKEPEKAEEKEAS